MTQRAPSAAWLLLFSAVPLLGLGFGCARDHNACSQEQTEGCLAACDQGNLVACRTLGVSLAQKQSAGLRAGAMLLERACLAGDAPSCDLLASLPVARALPATSASAPPPAPLPCPSFLASAAPSSPAPPPSASPSSPSPPFTAPSSPAPSSSAPLPSPTPAAPLPSPALAPPLPSPALATPSLPAEASREALDLAARCTRGEGVACTQLGNRFADGLGVPRSRERAIEAHTLGCERNDALGCRFAGKGLSLSRPEQASALLRRGCMGSDPGSCAALGVLALRSAAPGLTPPYGVNQLRSACTNAHAPACRRLASLLREGALVPRDEDAAARIEGRSLDLAQQSCNGGALDDCLLLGLWRERPGVLGDDPGETPRTTDSTSLDSALDSYQKACDGGNPAGCRRAIELLAVLLRKEPAAALWARLDATCSAGDAASCAELLAPLLPQGPSPAALARGCELALPRACALLAQHPSTTDRGPLLLRACRLGDRDGCRAHLEHIEKTSPAQLPQAQQELCERLGGASCVALARAVAPRDAACAHRLLRRACQESPERSPAGCAEAADELRPRDPPGAAELDRLACDEAMVSTNTLPLSASVAGSCARRALALRAAGQGEAALALAEASCEGGVAVGCGTLATLLRDTGQEPLKKRAQEVARKACQQGDRGACEQHFGALPAPSSSSPPRLPSFGDAAVAPACHLGARPGGGALEVGSVLLVLASLGRRRR